MHQFLSLLLVIIGLHVSVQSIGTCPERSFNRYSRSRLMVPNGLLFGSWGFAHMCPRETYASGFSLKVHEQSSCGRNNITVLTGVRLHCVYRSIVYADSVQSQEGSPGEWALKGSCPSGFLTAFQMSFRNTAANDIKFKCSRGNVLEDNGSSWGEWSGWSQTCEGRGICGIRTLMEELRGNRNYSILKNVCMYCCD